MSEKEKSVRFTMQQKPPQTIASVNFKIELKADTAGVTKSYWAYGNISRFAKEAIERDFDTISIASSGEQSVEEVWLPGCDEPLKVSINRPILDVTVFKASQPNSP